ncbi:MAG: 5-formyltetrahydrofolate cyclo-ligase [Leifsonia xyli]|nr:MAG: 5-formyltetrahydrofolate cyclo-ligase [Leifsonia xyli]
MPDESENRKRALRAELRERRRIRTATERERAGQAITEQLVQLAGDLDVGFIAAYLSTPDEPGTRDFLRWAADRGIRILLPVSREDGLLDWAPYDGEDEEQDILGMPTPTSELLGPIAINGVDLILVPAACVARNGMRLGWGRGYFDKTLGSMEGCPPVYAVIYDDELVDEVPTERHDMPVNGVVTPGGIVSFASS